VYSAEIPHYFKYLVGGEESTEPKIEHLSGLDSDRPDLTVNVIAGTGDWFGGWDGDEPSQGHRYSNDDATSGRMVELIERDQPAIMLCHWPGMYTHGTQQGFEDFKRVVVALDGRFRDRTLWMKLSEIARYWAAKELTRIEQTESGVRLNAPFASSDFTLRLSNASAGEPRIVAAGEPRRLEPVKSAAQLKSGSWLRDDDGLVVCFDLPRGESVVETARAS
jgi:hypothetical protein